MSDVVTQREFMTTWHSSPRQGIEAWSLRNKANLIGSGTSTDRVPPFRPFDLLAQPNDALVVLENDDHRIGVQSVCGAQRAFVRHVDFDTIYFQFAGKTTLETEFGEVEMSPGEILFIPEGIAHRSTGTADSLRWFAFVNDPFTEFRDGDDVHTGRTEFRVIRHGGPDWKIPAGAEKPVKTGIIEERMIRWGHGPNDRTIIHRDYDYLLGASSTHIAEKRSGIRKLRAFDIFEGVAGKKGGVEPMFRSPHMEIKTYNITGEQFAFHRALRSEEVRIQFRGEALDTCEIEKTLVGPGDATVIPRGIAHSVITEPPDSPAFLRLNFYSNLSWRTPNDLTCHQYKSTFEVQTIVHDEATWRIEAGLVVPVAAAR
jgi:quercetin dioxygenase-like cupin family protein